MKDGFVVGHVPKCFSLWMSTFLRLPKSSISCKITGNRVNREPGNGLEIPCEYSADGDKQAVDWLKKKISCEIILVTLTISETKQWTAKSIKQLLYCITVLISLDREHYNYFIL